MAAPATTLLDLPDELILEIIRPLSCIRSYETQSTAFKDKKKERARQHENHVRQLALHSICLASRRLRGIAIPTLYASFNASASLYGYERVRLFHRTITSLEHGLGLNSRLAEYIQYVEIRLADSHGNHLSNDLETLELSQYYYLLGEILMQVSNIQHLSIVSVENEEFSLWSPILPGHLAAGASTRLGTVASHGFPKLQTLNLQIHALGYDSSPIHAMFHRVCSAMTSVLSLTDLRTSSFSSTGSIKPLSGSFQSLRRLEITECELPFDEVLNLWSACEGLRHIVCSWAYLDGQGVTPSDLYTGLLRHSKTLETLCLNLREVRFDSPATQLRLGSLQPFTRLESLTICEIALLGTLISLEGPFGPDLHNHISDCLPESLKHLELLFTKGVGRDSGSDPSELDDLLELWHLAENCKSAMPELARVSVRSAFRRGAPRLTKAFNDIGLQFENFEETLQFENIEEALQFEVIEEALP
ncbi:hypothetical protein N0V83_007306 [Neocucurbitaria cava]|uniref:Uncharacterized protein n=1 Tax=Neocucurbitaria cava TaxID=798079 RepID=A0A9W8Y659_9PLEO|nr:hypothetical protein N0V83_007306 [Neocucurbitaria cava]